MKPKSKLTNKTLDKKSHKDYVGTDSKAKAIEKAKKNISVNQQEKGKLKGK